MTEEMTPETALALRKPFPKESIGHLPKGGMLLDFVGHAAVTDRLLTVDPMWSWEPMGLDERGLPALDSKGNLWIRLTICGVTRIGVGDGTSAKECIGDAIRNAAMRFGVALDLWAKENLVEFAQAAGVTTPQAEVTEAGGKTMQRGAPSIVKATRAQIVRLQALATDLGLDRDQRLTGASAVVGHPVESFNALTKDEASEVIERMQVKWKAKQSEAADALASLGASEIEPPEINFEDEEQP